MQQTAATPAIHSHQWNGSTASFKPIGVSLTDYYLPPLPSPRTQLNPNQHTDGQTVSVDSPQKRDVLGPNEEWWRDHYHWLDQRGYKLRPRYHPNWQPSWTQFPPQGLTRKNEDAQIIWHPHIMDATSYKTYSTQDPSHSRSQYVCLKRVKQTDFPREVKIALEVGDGECAKDVRNHCVPILQTIDVDAEWKILVMPFLLPFTTVPWRNSWEVIEFVEQLFVGMQYMHLLRLAHRDCARLNVMMDAHICYGSDFHPWDHKMSRDFSRKAKYSSRSKTRPKYYFIDFGLSDHYYEEGKSATYAGSSDKTVPEFKLMRGDEKYDPFATDVYMLGNLVSSAFKKELSQWTKNLGFMQTLLKEMTAQDPVNRPKMENVVEKFNAARPKKRRFLIRRPRAKSVGKKTDKFLGRR